MHSQEKVNPTLHDPIPQTEEDSVTAERKEEEKPVENTSVRDVPEEALPVATEKPDDESEQEGTTDGTGSTAEDGWCSCWDETSGAWYFHNTRTGETTWENPYVESTGPWPGTVAGEEGQGTEGETYADGTTDPFGGLLDHVDRVKAVLDGPSNAGDVLPSSSASSSVPWTGYYPSVGEYGERTEDRYRAYPNVGDSITGGEDYTVRAHFNSRTGKFQPIESVIEDPRDRFSQTAKAQRQCGVYFDYGSWAQMKGEKGGEGKVTVRSRKEIQILRQKKKEKKEQKRKAFFAD